MYRDKYNLWRMPVLEKRVVAKKMQKMFKNLFNQGFENVTLYAYINEVKKTVEITADKFKKEGYKLYTTVTRKDTDNILQSDIVNEL